MACFSPNMRLAQTFPELQKINPEIKSKTIKVRNHKAKNFPEYEWFEKQNELFKEQKENYEWHKIPCKECVGCQEAYSKEWATRCMLEASEWEQNWFITLTYDDEHIPREDEIVNKKTGEIFQNDNWMQGHLEPEDMQTFRKELREHWRYHYKHTNIRFYECGEYGGTTNRPHYHMILFNFPIEKDKLKIHKITRNGDILYECEEIQKIWKKGFISVAEVNWDTCAYVARYVMKKLKGKKTDEQYYENGITPEFVNMSRMPGIGLSFFDKNFQNIYKNDEIIIKGHKDKIQGVKPPSYFDEKYDLIDHEHMQCIKEKRKEIALQENKNKNRQTSLTERERLKSEELMKKASWCSLKRDKV